MADLHDAGASSPLSLRLHPGEDLRRSLELAASGRGWQAAFVVAGIGSLGAACLRLAGDQVPVLIEGDTELLTLSGAGG